VEKFNMQAADMQTHTHKQNSVSITCIAENKLELNNGAKTTV